MYQYFSLNNKKYPSKHTGAFEKEIQPHKMVKSFCESVVVLKLQMCLIQSPTMIFNQL